MGFGSWGRITYASLILGFLLSLAPVFPFGIATTMEAEAIKTGLPGSGVFDEHAIDPEFGKVIFHRDGQEQKQIYIIGQNHRSAITGKNDKKTLQAQLEIFRIGERLIRQNQVELLLPEGFFTRNPAHMNPEEDRNSISGTNRQFPARPDDETLRGKLADHRTFVDAAKLLNTEYHVPLAQVEDRDLYRAVAKSFQDLAIEKGDLDPAQVNRLLCYQERRTAAILQNIPSVVENEYGPGAIHNKQCLFIIGMAHIAEIIHFLEQERIELTPLPEDLDQVEPCELSLLKENYGITIILPRSLAEDEEALRLTKLLDLVVNK